MSFQLGPSRQPMADINVTPLVDVVLVLLIIFMVTAPLMQGGLQIDLPKVAARGLEVREGLIVSVRADRTIAVGNRIVPMADFERALSGAGAANRPVFLKADKAVPYGTIVELIARLRRSGVANLGLVTEPPPTGTDSVRNAVIGSGLVHVALLVVLFIVRAAAPIMIPGPDVVQVSLLDPSALTMPARPPAPQPKEEEASLPPVEDEGVKVAPPKPEKKKKPEPKKQEEPPPTPTPDTPAPALPYEAAGAAGLRGQISVDAADFAFTYYLMLVRNRVTQNWAPPAGLTAGGRPIQSVVYFRIARGGRLSAMRVEQGSGFEYFDRSTLRAVQLSDPLPPLPVGYLGSDLVVHFGFEFTAP
jgi:biopolymer transport protein TolR